MAYWKRAVSAVQEIAGHVIVTVALLASFKLVEYVYDLLWGKDSLILGLMPFKWLILVADVSIYLAFVYVALRSLLRAYRE